MHMIHHGSKSCAWKIEVPDDHYEAADIFRCVCETAGNDNSDKCLVQAYIDRNVVYVQMFFDSIHDVISFLRRVSESFHSIFNAYLNGICGYESDLMLTFLNGKIIEAARRVCKWERLNVDWAIDEMECY